MILRLFRHPLEDMIRASEGAKSSNASRRLRELYREGLLERRLVRAFFDAGHYKPEGLYKAVQFDLFNINAQCRGCNRYRHGNLGLYAERLIEKYGIEEFNALVERSRKTKSWTEKELLTLIVAIANPTNYMRIHNQLLNQL